MSGEHDNKRAEPSSSQSQESTGASDADTMKSLGAFPSIDFPTFLVSLYHAALVHLGEVAEEGQPKGVNLLMARQSIDILGLLGEKTKGNLSTEEERLLQTMLYELRMKFIQKSP